VQGFPHRKPRVRFRVPIRKIVGPLEQTDDAARREYHARVLHAVNAGALGAGERVRLAELAFLPSVLLEPMQTELRVVVEVVLGQEAVDKPQGRPHAHGRAVCFQHGGIF